MMLRCVHLGMFWTPACQQVQIFFSEVIGVCVVKVFKISASVRLSLDSTRVTFDAYSSGIWNSSCAILAVEKRLVVIERRWAHAGLGDIYLTADSGCMSLYTASWLISKSLALHIRAPLSRHLSVPLHALHDINHGAILACLTLASNGHLTINAVVQLSIEGHLPRGKRQ